MKNKVLLVKYFEDLNIRPFPPKAEKMLQIYPSLGLGYLASYLREKGVPVEILDIYAMNLSPEAAKEEMRKSMATVVGITTTTIGWLGAVECARLAREALPAALIVVGGPHLSLYPKECLSFPEIDMGVLGDGEETLMEIITRLEEEWPLAKIKGTVYRDENGNPVVAERRPFIEDLDSLPFPAVDLFPMERYQCLTIEKPFFTMTTTRGCPYKCAFCTQVHCGNKARFRSAESLAEEVEMYIKKYGAREIIMFDETFTLKKSRVLEFCRIIKERGLKFRFNIRTRVDLIDEEILEALKEAGCYGLHMGIESGSEEILRIMQKGITLKQVKKAFETARGLGFMTRGYFMLAYLDENDETYNKTLRLARELPLDWASFSITTPLPGTALYSQAMERGIIKEDFWREYTMGKIAPDRPFPHILPEGKSEEDLSQMLSKAYFSFYLRPGYMLDRLLRVRSFNQLKDLWNGLKIMLMLKD
ncbi:MAG: B12-binding domain-containing radical SAM protein [Chloroflexi bacterium]|nr:B12-binding domain-containing radical SAM protein [Chloroflexota bacterium]